MPRLEFRRVLHARREHVFDALTRPEIVKRWNRELEVCEIDLKVGGEFRFVWRTQGDVRSLRGVYRVVAPPERLVHTESFDPPWDAGEALVETILSEEDGRTTFSRTVIAAAMRRAERLRAYGCLFAIHPKRQAMKRTASGNLHLQDPFGNTLLHGAVISGDMQEVKRLLAAGADPRIANRDGRTALHAAAILGHREVYALLAQWPHD